MIIGKPTLSKYMSFDSGLCFDDTLRHQLMHISDLEKLNITSLKSVCRLLFKNLKNTNLFAVIFKDSTLYYKIER